MFYDNRKKEDLVLLKNALSDIKPIEKAALVAYCLTRKLVKKTAYTIKIAVFIAKLRTPKTDGFEILFQVFSNKHMADETEKLWDQIMNDMVSGHNKDDPQSAGGWSRQSLNGFLGMTRAIHIDLDKPRNYE